MRFPDRGLEREFAGDYAARSKGHVRAAVLLSAAGALPALAIAQMFLAGERAFLEAAWFFLLAFQLPCSVLVLLATYAPADGRAIQPVQAVVHVVWGLAAVELLRRAPLDGASAYGLVATVLVVFAAYAAVRMRFSWASGSGWTLSALSYALLLREPAVRALDLAIHGFTVVLVNAWGMFIAHRTESYLRRDFLRSRELAEANDRSERLLRNILPASVAERLKLSGGSIADRIDEATVLFADLVGFTPLAERREPEEIVGVLGEVFTRFDELADRHGLEKIKTIGDAYMVAGGLPEPHQDHAGAVAAMALEMREAVSELARRGGPALSLRIGIHSGPLVAGVIGKRKFSYDLWGDTVNTASRMESHGVAGRIQVSEATYERLRGRFAFEPRGPIHVKGKGEMATWFLEGS